MLVRLRLLTTCSLVGHKFTEIGLLGLQGIKRASTGYSIMLKTMDSGVRLIESKASSTCHWLCGTEQATNLRVFYLPIYKMGLMRNKCNRTKYAMLFNTKEERMQHMNYFG